MTIFTREFMPYEFDSKRDVYKFIEQRCSNLKRALTFVEMDNEHLTVRCPLSGGYLDIVGTIEEIDWLHGELTRREMYRIKR